MCSILSYAPLAERGRTCTFDPMVSEVTALFTTGKRIAGERATSVLGRRNAGLPRHRGRPDPRHAGPRGTGSTVRSETGGIRTRAFRGAKYPKSSPPAKGCPAARGGDTKSRATRRKQEARSGKAATGNRKMGSTVVAALFDERARRRADSSSPPRHRWTARSLARRSLRRAPRFGPARQTSTRSRDPGLPFRQKAAD